MKIQGITALKRALDRLPKEMQKAAEVTALRTGAKPVEKAAKGMAAKDSGLLSQSIGVTVRKNKSGALKGQLTARIGPRTGFGRVITRKGQKTATYADPAKYGHLVELGTSKTAAKPFIRPAVDSSGDQIAAGMAKGYAKGLERAVKRAKR